MIDTLCRWSVLLILIGGADASHATEIDHLVRQLGSDDFERRETASRRLAAVGEPALDALVRARTSDDVEVRRRSEKLAAVIQKKILVEERRLTGHANTVSDVAVSADGRRLVTSSWDGTLRIWDARTGQCLHVLRGHAGWVSSAALSPDGRRIASGGGDGTVRLWDARTGRELVKLTGHRGMVDRVTFGPKGQVLSAGHDRALRRWDPARGGKAVLYPAHADVVTAIAYHGPTGLVATGGHDLFISLRVLKSGKLVRTLYGHRVSADIDLAFSPDGQWIVSSNAGDSTIRILNVATGTEWKRLLVAACCAAFSPDGKRIVSGGREDWMVRVWDLATGRELWRYKGHTGSVSRVAFFPDGKRIVSGSADGTARVWRAPR